MGAVPIQIENSCRASPPRLHGRFVTVSPLGRPCILLYCQSDSCMSTKWALPPMCAMPNILSGRRHMDTVLMEPPACCKSPTPADCLVTVLPLGKPCMLLYSRSDSCMSTTTTWPPPMCVMLNISSGRRHMDTVPMKPPASPPTPPQTVCKGVLLLHRPRI